MYSFSHSTEVQFLYTSLHKQLQLKLMDDTYSQNRGQGYRGV